MAIFMFSDAFNLMNLITSELYPYGGRDSPIDNTASPDSFSIIKSSIETL